QSTESSSSLELESAAPRVRRAPPPRRTAALLAFMRPRPMVRRAGLRADERAVVERCDRNLAADELFDLGQRDRVGLAAEADRVAGSPCARRAADAMHVVLGV